MKCNRKQFINKFYKIRTKEGNLIPFKFNHAQNEFYEAIKNDYGKKPCRYIVLKARQLGISTFTEAMITNYTTSQFNTDSIIIAHDSNASASIYNMTKLYISELPEQLRPSLKHNNSRMLVFDNEQGNGLKSSIRVGVAGDGVRGQTYRYAHLSELAFWQHPKESLLALMQCIPQGNDTMVVIESTANGYNYFYELWQDAVNGNNDFTPVFFPWYLEPTYKRTYTGFELSDYERDIKAKYNLSNDQLEWRRWAIKNNCGNDEQQFRQEYPITPEEAFITSGNCVFDTEKILDRLKHIEEPIKRGYFKYDYSHDQISNIQWIDDKQGSIKIYKEPTNEKTILSGDTAGDGSDYFTGHVLSKHGEQMAVVYQQFDEDLYTKQMYCLGKMYNSLIAIESNFSTYPNMRLQQWGYENLYVRETYDNMANTYQAKFGFRTTAITRPIIIANLVEIMREQIELINDENTLKEALTFVKLNGKPQAQEGTHDDLIMALAIGYEALNQLPNERKRASNRNEYDEFFNYGA